MNAMAQALRAALLDFLWQGLVVALVLWVALFVLRKRSAQARYLASCAALGVLMALPAVTVCLAYQAPSAGRATAQPVAAMAATSVGLAVHSQNAAVNWMVRLEPWALPVWSLGVLLFSLRLVWSCRRVAAMRRSGRPADADTLATVAGLAARMGLVRPVRVLTAALPDGPSVAGWLKPVLLLPPATVLGLTPQQLEAVLAHELAHIRRYDHLVNAVQSLVETLLFYHPVVWWTSARIRDERELCCDDLAVLACGDALCFARALTKLERLRIMAPAAALGSTGGPLMYRVERLIGAGRQECAPSKLAGILAFSLAVACLALNVHWARGQEPPPAAVRGLDARNFVQYGDAPGVTVDLGGASVLHRTRVEYPEAARNSGIEGTVAVEVTLDTNGNVTDAHVVSGPMELRKAVMSSVFEWHFTQDAAGSARIVNVTFQKGVADASVRAAAQEQSRMEQEYMSRVQANLERNAGPPPVAVEVIQPRTLAGLEVVGLTGAAKADLLARLPVHAGDALSESSLRAAQEVVRKLDEHLVWQTTQQPDGATFIRIEADPERQNELNGRLLRELAAQQQALGQPQTAEQRWQQVMLRREAVQLYRQMSQAEAGSAPVQESQKLELQARLQAMFGSQEGAAKPQAMEDIQKLRALLDSLQKQIAGSAGSKEAEAKLTSRTVARIEVVGLSDAAKSDLLARLPVHAGDTLSEASLRGVGEAVRKFDEHLVWRATLQPDGTIWIHIETPGAPVTVGK